MVASHENEMLSISCGKPLKEIIIVLPPVEVADVPGVDKDITLGDRHFTVFSMSVGYGCYSYGLCHASFQYSFIFIDVDIRKLIREAIHEVGTDMDEGWGKNLAFAAGMALAGIGGVKAQGGQDQGSSHAAVVGYISNLSQHMGADKSPEQMAAMKEARVYFEAMRDGKQAQSPSQAAKVVINHVLSKMRSLSSQQLQGLAQAGMNINTVNEAKTDRQKLRDDQVKLTDEERAEVITKGATWDDGLPGVWKSVDDNGNVQYCSNTHRAMAVSTTLAAAIKKFPEIKASA